MKFASRLSILTLVAALIFIPLRSVYALDNLAGPIFGSNYTLKSGETLNEDLVVLGGSITIEQNATVTGSIVLIGGSLIMAGEGQKDVVVIGGAVSLGETAHIYGNLVTLGAPVNRAEGARVDGEVLKNPTQPAINPPTLPGVETIPTVSTNPLLNMLNRGLSLFAQSLGLGLLAALLVLFLPQQIRRVGEAIPAQPGSTGATGLLGVLIFITAIVALALFSILIITLILTIPLIILLAVAFSAAGVFGWIGLGTEIGLRLASALKTDFPLPFSAAVGTFLLNFVANGIGFIPCVGWVVPLLLGLASLGAVFLTRFGTRALTLAAASAPAENA
jgi:hypothetical protein